MPRSKPSASVSTPAVVSVAVRVVDSEQFGAVIRKHRKGRAVTLAEAAGLSGVGVRYLLELEHGKQTASLGKALQVLGRLGLDVWIVPRGHRVETRK